MEPTELRAVGLLLSAPTDADVEAIARACQDPDIQEWTTVPSPYTDADAAGFVADMVRPGWAAGTGLTWAVRDAEPGAARDRPRLLGMIGLDGLADGSAELGFWVAPWARGRGVAQRAVGCVLDHGFDPAGPGLARISWLAFVGNWPSRRVVWRTGFRFEGTRRLHAVQRGVRRDAWVGSIVRGAPREPVESWPPDAPERMTR